MMVAMNAQMASPEMRDNPFSGFGQAMAVAFVGPMIDSLITPAGVIAMMQNGSTKPTPVGRDVSAAPQAAAEPLSDYKVSYKGWSKVVARPPGQESGHFIFRRHGLWSWKLSAVEMPIESLAAN
jgi:hypothetical protein